jgi:phosphoribosyl 1,2-cyclic phosphodiesterase
MSSLLQLTVLASGSKGNAVYLEADGFGVLVDAGISCLQIRKRLASLGIDPAVLRAVCVTHEHSDHVAALDVLQRTLPSLDLYANSETARHVKCPTLTWHYFATGSPFPLGPFTVTPFTLPHDAYDPVGFTFAVGPWKIGIATDMGMPTQVARHHLSDCDAVILEANHEPSILRTSGRAPHLIQRILSRQGHLCNDDTATFASSIAAAGRLRHLFLAHLSRDCNRPELALHTVASRLRADGYPAVTVSLTYPDRPTPLLSLPL